MAEKLTVCICGGGNGAHAMAGLAAAHAQTESRVLTLFQDEAERWTKTMEKNDFIILQNLPDGSVREIKAKPSMVTKDASKAVPGANIIIFCVPAFAHQQYFNAILPYVEPDTAIIGLPGQPGFEFQCFDVLKEKARRCAILSYESLPWACRILEFGKKVEILGAKDSLVGSKITGKSNLKLDPAKTLQSMLGEHPVLKMANNYIEPYLMTKAIVHPPLLYARWKDWDGQPLSEKPLFYQGLDEFGAACLSGVSDEVVATAKAISEQKPELNQSHVQHLLEWYRQDYRETVADPTSLLTAMRTNAAYNGLVHPMKDAGNGKWVPDFNYRYTSEDIPYGLVVTKGLAELAGVPTPYTDKVLTWCQEKLGKEYIVGSELKGKDLKESRAPQAYGNLQSLGLQDWYLEPENSLLIKTIQALAFVPPDDVIEAFQQLMDSLDADTDETLSDFLAYFESTWLGIVQRGRRRRSKFDVAMWNVYSRVEDNLPRTNNSVEGWQRAFDQRMSVTHPTLGRLVSKLRKEQASTELMIEQHAMGVRMRKNKQYEVVNTRLQALVARYAQDDVLVFLKAVAHNL
nr:hypothetical protein BaRGS_023463 [Batillaria attramentaria]